MVRHIGQLCGALAAGTSEQGNSHSLQTLRATIVGTQLAARGAVNFLAAVALFGAVWPLLLSPGAPGREA